MIITDLIMPDKEGLETINELKKESPGIKIIAMSGGGTGRTGCHLDTAKLLGADATFEKPFARKELVKAIGELIESG